MIDLKFRTKKNGVPILSKNDMDSMAEYILRDYKEKVINEPSVLDIESFAEFYMGLQMDYQDLSHNRSLLGMMVFNDCQVPVYDAIKQQAKYISVGEGTALIDNSLLKEDQKKRGRFTIGHEASHWIFHRKKYHVNPRQLSWFDDFTGIEPMIKCKTANVEGIARKSRFNTDNDWMEWQADYMASALLMPKVTFAMAVKCLFKQIGIKRYYEKGIDADLDRWAEDKLPKMLANIFDVSIKAAAIRLVSLGFVPEKPLI